MADRTIHTINARGYVGFDVLKSYFELTPDHMHTEIIGLYDNLVNLLNNKGIKYSELRNALTPNLNNYDICLFFDTSKISDSWYGLTVFNAYFNLLHPKSRNSVLCGDLICDNQDLAFQVFEKSIVLTKPFDFIYSSSIYCIYISNVSKTDYEGFHENLNSLDYYIGFADMRFMSGLKMLLSTCLVNSFIKFDKTIILPHEDDRADHENTNLAGYPYNDYGYSIKSFKEIYFHSLLSYKIECPVLPGRGIDTEIALNSLGITIKELSEMEVSLEDKKLGYLRKEKLGKLALAGLGGLDANQIASQIKMRIEKSYIYNMCFKEEYNTMKFNIMLEFPHHENGYPVRAVAALEYLPELNSLRLISMM